MDEFENKVTTYGIHYTRYVASWMKSGGSIYRRGLFQKWLKECCKLTDREIYEITNLAMNGKLELEVSAEQYLKARDPGV